MATQAPTGVSTSNQGSPERTSRVTRGAAASLLARGLVLLTPLITTPITLTYMGVERYGLLAAAVSATTIFLFSDLGLGNGLMTKLGAGRADHDPIEARKMILAALTITSAMGLAVLIVIGVLALTTDLGGMFGATGSIPSQEREAIVVAVFVAFAVGIPLGLMSRVQLANQEAAREARWTIIGLLLTVPTFVAAAKLGATPFQLVLITVSFPLLITLISALVYFGRLHPELRPVRVPFDKKLAKGLLSLGIGLVVLTAITASAQYLDPFLISHTQGLDAVAQYAIAFRLTGIVGLSIAVVAMPLWPANGEALRAGDTHWVRKAAKRLLIFSAVATSLGGVLIVWLGPPLIQLWLGDTVTVGRPLLAGLALWFFVLALSSPFFMIQNAAEVLRPQMLAWALFLLISVPLRAVALTHFETWVAPLIAAGLFAVIVLPIAVLTARRVLRDSEERAPIDLAPGSEGIEASARTGGP